MIGNKQNVIPANGYANTRANNSQDSSSYTNQFPDIVNLMKEEIKDKNQINRLPAINTGTDNATNMPQRIAGQEVLSEPRKGADNIQRMQPISIAESTNMPADTLKQEDEKISRLKTPEEMTLEEFIKSHEGKPAPGQTKIASLDVYPDGRGNNTIGWGWNIADNGLPEDIKRYYENNKHTITQAHVNQLWKISYQKAEESCKRLFSEDVFNKLSENRKKALMDAVFNMGEEKIHGGFPKMVQNIKEGNFAQAANELKYRDGEKKDKLSGYYTQTGDRARDVIRLLTNG
jgi:GH24 family phage-related lysozyme (muramidase)